MRKYCRDCYWCMTTEWKCTHPLSRHIVTGAAGDCMEQRSFSLGYIPSEDSMVDSCTSSGYWWNKPFGKES